MFQYVDQNPSLDVKADILLERVVIGGSAAPRAMIERFDKQFSSYVIHAWGMTEMSPLGTTGNLLPKHMTLPADKRIDVQQKQGRVVYGVEIKITDDAGQELARDGKAFGDRSEERRVGKEGVSTCRSRGSP